MGNRVTRRRGWAPVLLGALLLQSLFPSGYMPASLSDGWLAMLCPEGLPVEFVQQLNGGDEHSHHHQHGADAQSAHGSDTSMDYCPLGSGVDQPVALASIVDTPAANDSALDRVLPVQQRTLSSPRRSGLARAPPIS